MKSRFRLFGICMSLMFFVVLFFSGCPRAAQKSVRKPDTSALDTRPTVGSPTPWAPLAPEVFELSNGVSVWYLRRAGLPLFTLDLMVPFGSALDPAGKAGLASITADMLDEGTENYSALQLSDEFEVLGASKRVHAGRDLSMVSLQVLERNLEPALVLVLEIIQRPKFDPTEFERVRKLTLSRLVRRRDEPTRVASLVTARAFYGEEHPYAHPGTGYEDSVAAVKLDELKRFHLRYWHPARATLVAVGDLEIARLEKLLEGTIGNWKTSSKVEPPPLVRPPARKSSRTQLVIVEKKDAPQTVIQIRMPGFGRRVADHGRLEMVNTVLGGSFTSRLMQNLREDKGYTYGAYSFFRYADGIGSFGAGASVQSEVTGKAIGEFLKELDRLVQGDIKQEEVKRARATLRNELVGSFESQGYVAMILGDLARYGLPPDGLGKELEQYESSDAGICNDLARKIVRFDDMTVVLVGDKDKILPQLEGLDLPAPSYRNTDGKPVPDK